MKEVKRNRRVEPVRKAKSNSLQIKQWIGPGVWDQLLAFPKSEIYTTNTGLAPSSTENSIVEFEKLLSYLHRFSFPYALATKIWKAYQEKGLEIIQTNPYKLVGFLWAVDFEHIDHLGEYAGIHRQDSRRVEGAILFRLYECAEEGHSCYPLALCREEVRKKTGLPVDLIDDAFQSLDLQELIHIREVKEPDGNNKSFLQLRALYAFEKEITQCLQRWNKQEHPLDVHLDQHLSQAQVKLGTFLSAKQLQACYAALSHQAHVISGGLGSGKTALLNVIMEVGALRGQKMALIVPTVEGSAKQDHHIIHQAKNIHTILDFDKVKGGYRYHQNNTLPVDLLLIDDLNKIDTVQFSLLLRALTPKTQVVMIGDADQLPAVGVGRVLADLLQSGAIPFSELPELQGHADSKIIQTAHLIRNGIFPDLANDNSQNLFFIQEEDTDRIADTIVDLVTTRLPASYGFNPQRDIQVLSPMSRGLIGARHLNDLLQARFQPTPHKGLATPHKKFFVGDRVIQLVDNYSLGLFKGALGFVEENMLQNNCTIVRFGTQKVAIPFDDLDQLDLAYAVRIHAFQNKESDCVVMPVHTTHYTRLYRSLLYTAITRSKRMMVLVGTKKAVWIAVKNGPSIRRYSGLKQMLLT